MRRQSRDVTGGDEMLASLVPGWGLMNYVLGWFTVPIEVLLRRNFGERYFTAPNFFAGLIVLLLVQFVGWVVGLLNPLNYIGMIFGRGGASVESWMGPITTCYFWLGMAHFLRIWWLNVIGSPNHSFSAGQSWLRPIGKAVMFMLNLFLNAIVRVIFMIDTRLDKRRLAVALPVLQDTDAFTERYIEPAFIMVIALMAAGAGQSAVFFWLLFSAMALNVYTGMRHEQQRGYWLDIQDNMIEANYFQQIKNGNGQSAKKSYERMVKKAAFEAEANPEMVPIIERSNPTLADAMKAVSPQLRKVVNHFDSDQQGRQAA